MVHFLQQPTIALEQCVQRPALAMHTARAESLTDTPDAQLEEIPRCIRISIVVTDAYSNIASALVLQCAVTMRNRLRSVLIASAAQHSNLCMLCNTSVSTLQRSVAPHCSTVTPAQSGCLQ
jgi:hypothetical protein